jgi:hypothetical protein
MDDLNFYSQKPELNESTNIKSNWISIIISVILFTLIFMFIFSNQVNFILDLVIVLLIHEIGHFIMMKLFKYKNVRMLFIPMMGAFVQGKKESYSQKESLLIAGAGPFPGLIIGFLLILFSQQFNSTDMFLGGLLFFILNFINLAPLEPLDGGQLLKLFFNNNHEKFIVIFTFVSSIFIIIIGFVLNNFLIIIFGFLMGFKVHSLQKKYQLHKEMKNEDISFVTSYKDLSNKDFWKIKQIILENTPVLKKYFELNNDQEEKNIIIAQQVNSLLITPIKKDASFILKIITILLWIFSLFSPLILYFLIDLNWVQYAIPNW